MYNRPPIPPNKENADARKPLLSPQEHQAMRCFGIPVGKPESASATLAVAGSLDRGASTLITPGTLAYVGSLPPAAASEFIGTVRTTGFSFADSAASCASFFSWSFRARSEAASLSVLFTRIPSHRSRADDCSGSFLPYLRSRSDSFSMQVSNRFSSLLLKLLTYTDVKSVAKFQGNQECTGAVLSKLTFSPQASLFPSSRTGVRNTWYGASRLHTSAPFLKGV
mmetsp:Transcript_2199/g.8581  ORF Transcript_2199/g.8581 Transcript_2199/m.8581 type:complete len:224 (+) Transcript_2199:215-886(+)